MRLIFSKETRVGFKLVVKTICHFFFFYFNLFVSSVNRVFQIKFLLLYFSEQVLTCRPIVSWTPVLSTVRSEYQGPRIFVREKSFTSPGVGFGVTRTYWDVHSFDIYRFFSSRDRKDVRGPSFKVPWPLGPVAPKVSGRRPRDECPYGRSTGVQGRRVLSECDEGRGGQGGRRVSSSWRAPKGVGAPCVSFVDPCGDPWGRTFLSGGRRPATLPTSLDGKRRQATNGGDQ